MILDTCFILDLWEKHPGAMELAQQLDKAAAPLYVPSVVAFELWVGLRRAVRPRVEAERVSSFVAAYPTLSLSAGDCKQAALLHNELSREGRVLPTVDLMLAGMARSRSEVLVTRDPALLGLGAPIRVQGY